MFYSVGSLAYTLNAGAGRLRGLRRLRGVAGRRTAWRRTGRAEFRFFLTVGLKGHKNECNAGGLTAAAVYPTGLRTGRGKLSARCGNGVVAAAGNGKHCRAAARDFSRNGGFSVRASYFDTEVFFVKGAGSGIVLNGYGDPAFIFFTAFAAHNIQSFHKEIRTAYTVR